MFILCFALFLGFGSRDLHAESRAFVDKIVSEHELSERTAQELIRLLTNTRATRNIGTEDPDAVLGPNNSSHPVSRRTCQDNIIKTGLIRPNRDYERMCGARWMSPLPGSDGAVRTPKVCIDQFEFPNMPCEYPLVWTSASQASRLCKAMGKRLCHSHEWEGACTGRLDTNNPYRFDIGSQEERLTVYNRLRPHVWAYSWNAALKGTDHHKLCAVFDPDGPEVDPEIKSKAHHLFISNGESATCHKGSSDYNSCGTNTYPSGFKAFCRTRHDVYDLHGNVHEAVNYPTTPSGMVKGAPLDLIERKGSFFVQNENLPTDCRFRQPTYRGQDEPSSSHTGGFRCCKDID